MEKDSSLHTPLTRFLTRRRFSAVLPFVQGSVLDLGCGAAEILDFLPDGTRYVGVDAHPGVIGWLGENRPGPAYFQANVETDRLTLADRFDTILMLALLEHLIDPVAALGFAKQYAKPSGRLILTTPTRMGMAVHSLLARLNLVSRFAAAEHVRAYDHDEIACLLSESGLEPITYRTFLFGGNQLCICKPA